MAQTVKNLPAMQETQIPSLGLGRTPGEGSGYPFQYSSLENAMDREAWPATVHGGAKSQFEVTENERVTCITLTKYLDLLFFPN